jgi:hypothetical protein
MPSKKGSVPKVQPKKQSSSSDSDSDVEYANEFMKMAQDHDPWLKVQAFAERMFGVAEQPRKVQIYFFPGKSVSAASHFDPSKNELYIIPIFALIVQEDRKIVKLKRPALEEVMDGSKYLVVSETEWRKLDPSKPVNRLVINMKQKTSHGHQFYPASIDSRDNEYSFVQALPGKFESQIETPVISAASAVSVDDV